MNKNAFAIIDCLLLFVWPHYWFMNVWANKWTCIWFFWTTIFSSVCKYRIIVLCVAWVDFPSFDGRFEVTSLFARYDLLLIYYLFLLCWGNGLHLLNLWSNIWILFWLQSCCTGHRVLTHMVKGDGLRLVLRFKSYLYN